MAHLDFIVVNDKLTCSLRPLQHQVAGRQYSDDQVRTSVVALPFWRQPDPAALVQVPHPLADGERRSFHSGIVIVLSALSCTIKMLPYDAIYMPHTVLALCDVVIHGYRFARGPFSFYVEAQVDRGSIFAAKNKQVWCEARRFMHGGSIGCNCRGYMTAPVSLVLCNKFSQY